MKSEFDKKIRLNLQKELEVKSVSGVPTIEKIVINMGVGKVRDNKQFISECLVDMVAISGQKPVTRPAKKAISNFKIREGQLAGITVTLRGNKMWDFYEKLVKIVFPRVKDFRGLSTKSFDEGGNYSIGLREHAVFPEVDPNRITFMKPLQITIKTTAKDAKSGYILLKALGMPFKK